MDAAFAGGACQLVDLAGIPRPIELRRWRGSVDATDRALLLARCHGRTIDVGCGPGRLVAGLAALDVPPSASTSRPRRCGRPAVAAPSPSGVTSSHRFPAKVVGTAHCWPTATSASAAIRSDCCVASAGSCDLAVGSSSSSMPPGPTSSTTGGVFASATASRRSSTGRRSAWTRSNGCRTQPASRSRTGPRRANATSRCCVGLLPDEGHRRRHRRADPTTPRFLEPRTRYPHGCAGRHPAGQLCRHLLRDRAVEPLPVRVAGMVADRPASGLALPGHPGPARRHRDGGDPVGAGQALVGLSAPVPSVAEGRVAGRSHRRAGTSLGLLAGRRRPVPARDRLPQRRAVVPVGLQLPGDPRGRGVRGGRRRADPPRGEAPVGAHRPAEPDRRSAVASLRTGRAGGPCCSAPDPRPCSRCC